MQAGKSPFVSIRIGESLLDLVPDPTFDPASAGEGPFLHFCVTLEDLPGRFACFAKPVSGSFTTNPWRAAERGVGLSIYAQDPDG